MLVTEQLPLEDAMRSIVVAAIVGIFLALLPGADVAAQAAEYETTQIGDGVYQFRFRSHNGFFVVTDQGIVAFDPISVAAAERYAAATCVTASLGKPRV